MKRGHWLGVCCLLCLLPVMARGAAVESYFPWLDTVLCLDWADEEDGRQQGWTVPEGQRMVRLHFSPWEEQDIPTVHITENVGMFSLRDASGTSYPADTYLLQGVSFDMETGIFSTNETQEGFDLIFVIPEEVPLDSLEMLVETEKLDEKVLVMLNEVERKPAEE